MHEASLWENNCFLTLTYADEKLPKYGTLIRRDLQLFLKRLRKHAYSVQGHGFRFYGCGEYGELLGRPHYHVCVFNFDFADRKLWRHSPSGFRLFRSEQLEKLWTAGNAEIGDVTFESAAYVARYCTKKITGEDAASYYDGRMSEFSAMSLRPAIGQLWIEKFFSDVYPSDFVLSRGAKAKPPRYYDKKLEKYFPGEYEIMKDGRRPHELVDFRRRKSESSDARLAVKEEIASSRLAMLKRSVE